MLDKKFKNTYRIPSTRATWDNYGSGAYFISVCTKNRVHYFGKIVEKQNYEPVMQLSSIGKHLQNNLQNINIHYSYAEIPLFVVMPNHWHAIMFIDGEKTPYQRRKPENIADRQCRDVVRRVFTETAEQTINKETQIKEETRHATSLQGSAPKSEQMQNIANLQGWLSVVIGGIKSSITKFANENKIDFAWQTRFDDRIIRNQDEMNRIADYVENNVTLWNNDCFNEIRDAAS